MIYDSFGLVPLREQAGLSAEALAQVGLIF